MPMGEPGRVSRSPSSWRRYLRFWRADLRGDVDDELAFHLEMRKRDLEAHGLASPDARAEAERTFGDLSAIRDACVTIDERRFRRAGRTEVMADMWNDLRLAARGLRKTPGFAAMAIACIALGVGATTTILSAVNAILVRPLPYRDADRLLAIYSQNIPRGYHGTNISWQDFDSWRTENKSLERLSIWGWTTKTLADGESERLAGAYVSANLFRTLGVAPIVGRDFAANEEILGQDQVVLLSYGLWQRRFAGDSSLVGRSITLDARPYVVVGIMPPHFNFPDRGDVWIPFAVDPAREARENRGYAGAIGRLKPGVTLAQARADLETVSQRLQRDYPNENTGWSAEVKSMREDLTGDLRTPLLVFLAAVGLVLLIACANVANLMLARGASRHREIAVRTALGAARGRLVRQLLTESMFIAVLGGLLGAAIGVWGVGLFKYAFPGDLPFYFTLSADVRALAVAAGVIVLTGGLFGVLPALRTTRVDVNAALRDGARAGDASSRVAMRNALVVGEVGLSVILMVGAMLLIRSYRAYVTTDLGFEQRGILTARLTLPRAVYPTAARRIAFFEQLLARAAALPGVSVVGSSQGIPFSGWDVQAGLAVFGRPPAAANQDIDTHYQYVFPSFFTALDIPLLKGRWIAATDRDTLNPVGVVNETFAAKVFPNEDPIGKRVKLGSANSPDPWITIVGVIRDFRHYRLPQPMGPALYMPYATGPSSTQTLSIRTTLPDPQSLVASLRDVVRQIDPQLALYDVRTMDEAVNRSLWRQRLQGQVLGIFASLALLLAVVGIYGVISYTVAQRTRELGVRVALGAQRVHVLGLVLGHGARLAGIGIAVGLVGAFALKGTLASLLYGVKSTDLVSFVGVPVLLGAVTLIATYLPARRATKVDPLIAIRAE
jgi:putative ABC transport system permease protein